MSQIEEYEHYGRKVKVRSDLKGQHRDYCLCHRCSKLDMNDRSKNCQTANELYALCCKYGMVTPVFECPEFKDK